VLLVHIHLTQGPYWLSFMLLIFCCPPSAAKPPPSAACQWPSPSSSTTWPSRQSEQHGRVRARLGMPAGGAWPTVTRHSNSRGSSSWICSTGTRRQPPASRGWFKVEDHTVHTVYHTVKFLNAPHWTAGIFIRSSIRSKASYGPYGGGPTGPYGHGARPREAWPNDLKCF
jgi:hypothetical protein